MKSSSNKRKELDGVVFTKDSFSLGFNKNIILNSILLIDEYGFDAFTFKRLAHKIRSSEASIHLFFEDKHALMTYLLTWYWSWMEYRLTVMTANVNCPEERLKIAIKLLTSPLRQEPDVPHVDGEALYRIVISESQKVYIKKSIHKEQRLFFGYKELCNKVAEIVGEINAEYRYPAALISSIIESSHNQWYFAQNLPPLTEISTEQEDGVTEFLTELAFKTIKKDYKVNYIAK